jgi:predicted extracellular nuclease/LysM repeat protein
MKRFRSIFLLCLALWLTIVAQQAQAQLPALAGLVINEIGLDDAGRFRYVELYDGGAGNTELIEMSLVFFNAPGNFSSENSTVPPMHPARILRVYELVGAATDTDGYFRLDVEPEPDAPTALTGTVGVALFAAGADRFSPGAPLTEENRLDALVFQLSADGELLAQMLPGSEALLPAAAPLDSPAGGTIPPAPGCGSPATPIHEIQAASPESPLANPNVAVEGVVTGDFQNVRTQLRGFFLQEEAGQMDDDPATSEGLFVLDNGFDVNVTAGDVVRVEGRVEEFNQLTRLKNVRSVGICSRGNLVEPASVVLPEATEGELERYEGMLVRIDTPMTVAQTYFLGRYGQLTLSANGRLFQPTSLYPPGSAEAQAQAGENLRRLLVLDDGQDIRSLGDNPNPVPYIGAPPPSVIRAGDMVTNLVGVLDYGRINSAPGAETGRDYRLHPVEAPLFVPVNLRTQTGPEGAPEIGGTLRIASFNVLNYFNGNGRGGGFPTPRGAATPSEFARQNDKTIAAILALGGDVIGLMEIENDGYGPESAIQELVAGLNTIGGPLGVSFAAIDPGLERLGSDEIAVGLIYQPSKLQPVGAAATLATGAFDQALADGVSRQPLAQTFEDLNGQRFTVVVNHFKSKRPSPNATGGDVDTGDGAGSWNQRRTEAANELVAWLASDPTASGDPDFLIIGDLNAYARETPIQAVEAAGYTNLIAHFGGADAYSYIFDGQSGYLDHALASASLVAQAAGAAEWHINADEPAVIDYTERFNPPGYYSPDPYRASDHDPVIVGLLLDEIADEGGGEGLTGGDGPAVDDCRETYIVQRGDNLTRIAEAFGVRLRSLIRANGIINANFLYVGQPICIPKSEEGVSTATSYTVQPGDTLAAIAWRFGVTIHQLVDANAIPNPGRLYVGQVLSIPR